MRTGAYGAICVIIALTASILGGYLLNADTVTDCETEFTYVTDIAGAFEGSTGDVEMDYNPSSNVTGWSTSSAYNEGYMTGVNFVPAPPNSYFFYGDGSGPSTTEADTITIQSFEENGVSRWQAVSVNKGVIVDDLECSTMRIAEPGAVSPANQLRLVYVFDVSDVMTGYGYTDYETLNLSMSIAFPSNWPGILYQTGLHYHYKTANHPAYYTYDGDPVTEATVYGGAGSITIGESSRAITDNVRCGFIGSFTMTVTAKTAEEISYVDPGWGIRADGDSSVYWNNDQQNLSTEIVFCAYDLNGDSVPYCFANMRVYSENHDMIIGVEQTNNAWRIGQYTGDPTAPVMGIVEIVDLGTWPAISVTISNGDVVVRPIANFVSFSSYDLVDVPIVIDWDVLEGEDLLYFMVARNVNWGAEEAVRMQVMNTTVRVVEGGLYLQDGAFDVTEGFPATKAFKLVLGSAAHVGDSVTVSGTGGSATIQVTQNGRFVVDGAEIPFGQCALMWVSSTMPTATIDNQTYPAALYQKAQGYTAGTVWMSTPTGMVEIGAVGDDPTVTLDGLWAPAVYFYTGEQDASSHTEFVDLSDGVFKWDKSQLILVMMGLSIVLGLAGSYWGYTKIVDWMIIIGCIAGAWMIL